MVHMWTPNQIASLSHDNPYLRPKSRQLCRRWRWRWRQRSLLPGSAADLAVRMADMIKILSCNERPNRQCERHRRKAANGIVPGAPHRAGACRILTLPSRAAHRRRQGGEEHQRPETSRWRHPLRMSELADQWVDRVSMQWWEICATSRVDQVTCTLAADAGICLM